MNASSSSSIVTEAVVAFLKKVPPFQFLPAADLSELAQSMSVEYFPKDTVILTAGSKPSDSLYIVQKGGVKLAIRTGVGKELTLDMRSEGEFFGLLSLMGRDIARLDVIAVEDTLCYSLPARDVQQLVSRHPDVADYLFRTSVTRYMDRTLTELRERSRLMADGERLLYSLAVRDVATAAPVTCGENATIQEAARLVSGTKGTCLFVTGAEGQAVGIVTHRDFADKVVAGGLSPELPITHIMSAPVIAVDSGQRVFEALVAMLGRDIHHVLVTDEGRPASVLSNHDLLLLQGKSPLSVVRHIERQRTLDELAEAQKRVADLLPLLLREGAKASHITRVIAEVNDRVITKILQLAKARLGPAPAPYCWVALGSEGRAEQTFKSDQDNGLILSDATDTRAEEYFSDLAAFARDALARCGYPPCPGDFMASNPRWRQPLSVWQRYFYEWIEDPGLRSTEDALIFFDMRAVAGDVSLFENLAAHVRRLLKTPGLFQSVLAFISVDARPPLGFFRTFVVERTGEHKEELDLKLYGTQPIAGAARLFALAGGVEHTNTVDRLAALQSPGGDEAAIFRDLEESFEFLTLLRLECQLRQARAREPVSNYVRPESLTALQKTMLRQAFQTIGRTQSLIEARFKSAEWAQLRR